MNTIEKIKGIYFLVTSLDDAVSNMSKKKYHCYYTQKIIFKVVSYLLIFFLDYNQI